jgi:hypothetical protein
MTVKKARKIHLPPYKKQEVIDSITSDQHTVTTASRFFKISRETIYSWLWTKGIKYTKQKAGIKKGTKLVRKPKVEVVE